MAATWDGFTEEDIKNMAKMSDSSKTTKKPPKIKAKPKTYITPPSKTAENGNPVGNLPNSALLQNLPNESQKVPEISTKTEADTAEESSDVVESSQSPGETLEQFHTRQKLLEEQNRQRKDFLAKILSDRKKQTTEEAKRLQTIQDELHKLDLLLSDDVAILRDQIEVASKEFGEAQKRFNRAEKEFLESKQCLFSKMERKELLTKHLCTIIEQNEMRKAQKLSELMGKLSLDQAAINESERVVGPSST